MPARTRSRLGLVLALGGLALAPALAAEDPLKAVLTPEEYAQAGLAKLDAGEQAALLRAMQRRGLAKAETPAPAVSPVVVAPPAPAEVAKPTEKKGLWARVTDFGAEQLPAKKSKEEGEITDVDAQMTHPFGGLQGGTIFRLDNGQVWQQRIQETYYIGKSIPNPKVTIRRTRLGYRLLIPAVEPDFAVAVKRIQ